MQRVGLEWLFRLAQEPRRLWRRYLIGIPVYLFGVLTDLGRPVPARPRAAAGAASGPPAPQQRRASEPGPVPVSDGP
jgi:hypothetical protein